MTESEKQLCNTAVYVEVSGNTEGLITIVNATSERLWKRADLRKEAISHFFEHQICLIRLLCAQ